MEAVYWEKREERREEREESFVVCAEKLGPCREIEMPMRWILLTRLHLLLQLAKSIQSEEGPNGYGRTLWGKGIGADTSLVIEYPTCVVVYRECE